MTTLFVVNPGVEANGPGQPAVPGHIHTIEDTHPAAALARGRRDGWRLATKGEVREYCTRYNVDLPASLLAEEIDPTPKEEKPVKPAKGSDGS